jgi:hypothetical protein
VFQRKGFRTSDLKPEAACGYPGPHKTQPAFSTIPDRAQEAPFRDDDGENAAELNRKGVGRSPAMTKEAIPILSPML